MDTDTVIRLNGITKRFGSVTANDCVDFSLKKGEIHAVLGENGSGKSTLMNILSGLYRPDAGEVYINGKPTVISSPAVAISHGIGMIHQHFKLAEAFTALDNVLVANPQGIFKNSKKKFAEISALSKSYGFDVDLRCYVKDMPVGQKQAVEIIKVLYKGADILILDEPTAVLTPQETEKLFGIMRSMRDAGKSIIFISHKLGEVMAVTNRVTVLRKGKSVATFKTGDIDELKLVRHIVGKEVDLAINRTKAARGEKLLEAVSLSANDIDGSPVLHDVSFDVYEGEILGVAGVAGSGQKQLCETLAGLNPKYEGSVKLLGENLSGLRPIDIIRRGVSMSFVPEDRLGMGLVAGMTITENMMLKEHSTQKGLFINKKPYAQMARDVVKQLSIDTPDIDFQVSRLSGGNIQKVLVGRELRSGPKLLIMAYPVRGLDIGASMQIYSLINSRKEAGTGIIYVGEDLDVLMQLCDRILVLCHGCVTGIADARKTTKTQLGFMMTGQRRENMQ
ncbi:MAG: ABC transporter ATP-binding protein [Christensenellales bacterium]